MINYSKVLGEYLCFVRQMKLFVEMGLNIHDITTIYTYPSGVAEIDGVIFFVNRRAKTGIILFEEISSPDEHLRKVIRHKNLFGAPVWFEGIKGNVYLNYTYSTPNVVSRLFHCELSFPELLKLYRSQFAVLSMLARAYFGSLYAFLIYVGILLGIFEDDTYKADKRALLNDIENAILGYRGIKIDNLINFLNRTSGTEFGTAVIYYLLLLEAFKRDLRLDNVDNLIRAHNNACFNNNRCCPKVENFDDDIITLDLYITTQVISSSSERQIESLISSIRSFLIALKRLSRNVRCLEWHVFFVSNKKIEHIFKKLLNDQKVRDLLNTKIGGIKIDIDSFKEHLAKNSNSTRRYVFLVLFGDYKKDMLINKLLVPLKDIDRSYFIIIPQSQFDYKKIEDGIYNLETNINWCKNIFSKLVDCEINSIEKFISEIISLKKPFAVFSGEEIRNILASIV